MVILSKQGHEARLDGTSLTVVVFFQDAAQSDKGRVVFQSVGRLLAQPMIQP